ncbi:uncharacterized protein LOC130824383 isoform X1 [Amaranthus tricolor]|uniref:uncharacterized protein LOC130824383 isoform X1 n=1 Tax=Amaranthus tricolor TaxID=29722 RepID=UPI0025853FD8|nr:uncharacterized protein LOC130824383 isoform X1 [Amaranthus tricolor]
MVMISIWVFLGFILGLLTVILIEALVILYVIRRLIQPTKPPESVLITPSSNPLDHLQSVPSVCQKQGVIWVLDPQKQPKIPGLAGQNKKREIVEVSPVRKLAKVKDRTLILTEADGSLSKILLKGCKVVAVSATSLPGRKWAKRYPIKVESKNAVLYQGSKVFYIYAETSWEKESWCKALRLASSDDKERLLWFSKLNEEFRDYLKSLCEGYPSLIKPSGGCYLGTPDKANQLDEPLSKVRQFWRKLSRKTSLPSLDEKRISNKSHIFQDHVSIPSTSKTSIMGKLRNECDEDSSSVSFKGSTRSGSSTHGSEISEAETAEKSVIDEGTLCWNLLLSRLFFDAKSNVDIKAALKARIQRSLSTIRIPSYIGEITCTDAYPGNLPPYIHGMRAVPMDMNDVWAIEMDIEYSGGVVLNIETRLEVRELDSQNDLLDHNIETSSLGEETADLLEDFKHLQEDLKLSVGNNDASEQKDSEDSKFDMLRSSRTGSSTANPGSRWKSLLNSVAKHVSQVPLTLAIRVATLRGTIQLHMKPPPSDQIWFGFTCMPDIQFELESSVRDHKVTNGRVASFLINRFKASIRDTLVLPNCESLCVSWMLAEKDDWVPRNAAPLLWLNREAPSDTLSNDGSKGKRTDDRDLESKEGKLKRVDSGKQSINEESGVIIPSATTIQRSSSEGSVPSQDLKVPLLQNGEAQDLTVPRKLENPESHLPTRYVSLKEEQTNCEDDDSKPKKVGRRARMLDLGKKMGEKLEEKRRHIEEKGRHIVEKMRGP